MFSLFHGLDAPTSRFSVHPSGTTMFRGDPEARTLPAPVNVHVAFDTAFVSIVSCLNLMADATVSVVPSGRSLNT